MRWLASPPFHRLQGCGRSTGAAIHNRHLIRRSEPPVLTFIAPGTPLHLPISMIPLEYSSPAMSERPDDDDDGGPDRRAKALTGIIVILVLAILGVILIREMGKE